jgi:hypothetical protein
MTCDLPARDPGTQIPGPARDSATRAGQRSTSPDLRVLERVRDALARLPDSALHRSYFEVPGHSLASPGVPPGRRSEARPSWRTLDR